MINQCLYNKVCLKSANENMITIIRQQVIYCDVVVIYPKLHVSGTLTRQCGLFTLKSGAMVD